MALTWTKYPPDGDFAKRLRRGIRMHRRERGRSGNRFSYNDLRVVWGADADHAVLTHTDNALWQYWWRHPEKGWFLQSWHRLLSEALEEAESPRPLPPPEDRSVQLPGLYVRAYWEEPYRGDRPLIVQCGSEGTALLVREAFSNLGCSTELTTVV